MPKDYSLEVTPPAMQRRPENVQDETWIVEFLNRAQIGHIATHWDDQPFINPTTFWHDAERHAIYFHSNIIGRVRANSERHNQVCFEASAFGRLLPSNVALEFSIQYESVIAFGVIRVVDDQAEKERALSSLIHKYFTHLTAGKEYRPITEAELKRTSVYAIEITSWSGKRNWPEEAEQSDEWPKLITPQAH